MTKNIGLKNNNSGFAALVAVVIIGAASLLIAKNISILSQDELEIAYILDRGEAALNIAEGCVEETIRRFELNPDYSASDFNLELGGGECLINTTTDGNGRLIVITAHSADFYKKINADISLDGGGVILNSWTESD